MARAIAHRIPASQIKELGSTAEVDAPRYRKHFESRTCSPRKIYNTTRGVRVEFRGTGPRIDGIPGTIRHNQGIFERCATQTSGRMTGSWLDGILPFPEWMECAVPKGVRQLGGTLDGGVDLGFKRWDHGTLRGRVRSPRVQPTVQPGITGSTIHDVSAVVLRTVPRLKTHHLIPKSVLVVGMHVHGGHENPTNSFPRRLQPVPFMVRNRLTRQLYFREAWIDRIWREREGAANILYPVLHLGPEHTVISEKVVKSMEGRQKGTTDATNLSFYPRKTVLEISETMVEKYTYSRLHVERDPEKEKSKQEWWNRRYSEMCGRRMLEGRQVGKNGWGFGGGRG
ncbi:hypothetical protein B0H14DRAFT_2585522 [Mycena olivaceomarginata]|nr:hypothetical protein B0H14DRAFT_2585522 [Mycena olivaceomarginata]